MQGATLAVTTAALMGLAGCATAPDSAAQGQCQYFARAEGLELVRVAGTTASGDATRVDLQLKDALGRPFKATCVSAGGKTSWAQPLPENTVRRWEGDTVGNRR